MWPRFNGLRVLELGTPGASRDHLNTLVLAGAKTGTTGHWHGDYLAEGETLETVGEHLALLDNNKRHVATLQVSGVAVVPIAEVRDQFIATEGEDFLGAGDWQTVHRAFWQRRGLETEDTTLVVCLNFAVIDTHRPTTGKPGRS